MNQFARPPVPGLLLLFLLSPAARAANIHVDPAGNDGGSGAPASPFKSLARAIRAAANGDRINIRSGTYLQTETLKIYGKRNLEIHGESPLPEIIFSGARTYGFSIGEDTENVTLTNLSITWSSSNDGNIIGIGGRNTRIESSRVRFDPAATPKKYDAIKILSTALGVFIQNNEISGAPQQCIDSVGGGQIHIQGNKMSNCSNAVVLKGGASRNRIEKNVITGMKYGAIGLGGTTNSKFIVKDYENRETTVRDNLIHYANGNNIGGGIFLRGAQLADISHNTIIGAGIHVKSGGDPKRLQFASRNNRISHNIIWTTGNDGILVVDPGNMTGLQFTDNCYWRPKGVGEFKIDGKWYTYPEYRSRFGFDSGSRLEKPALNAQFAPQPGSACNGSGRRNN